MSTLRVNTLQEADGTAFPLGVRASDQWRVTSDFISNQTNPISSNWERVDTDGFGQLATGMTQSSGVFTFPSTGIWRIDFQASGYRGTSDSIRYLNFYIMATTDGSNYGEASYGVTNIHNAQNCYASATISHQFDVTNVSTHKINFKVEAENDIIWIGSSSQTITGATFTKLGDT
tara:strand:- start:261 stop:785 length:525 start_codon:yes stop_codon:yes gene_type:complete